MRAVTTRSSSHKGHMEDQPNSAAAPSNAAAAPAGADATPVGYAVLRLRSEVLTPPNGTCQVARCQLPCRSAPGATKRHTQAYELLCADHCKNTVVYMRGPLKKKGVDQRWQLRMACACNQLSPYHASCRSMKKRWQQALPAVLEWGARAGDADAMQAVQDLCDDLGVPNVAVQPRPAPATSCAEPEPQPEPEPVPVRRRMVQPLARLSIHGTAAASQLLRAPLPVQVQVEYLVCGVKPHPYEPLCLGGRQAEFADKYVLRGFSQVPIKGLVLCDARLDSGTAPPTVTLLLEPPTVKDVDALAPPHVSERLPARFRAAAQPWTAAQQRELLDWLGAALGKRPSSSGDREGSPEPQQEQPGKRQRVPARSPRGSRVTTTWWVRKQAVVDVVGASGHPYDHKEIGVTVKVVLDGRYVAMPNEALSIRKDKGSWYVKGQSNEARTRFGGKWKIAWHALRADDPRWAAWAGPGAIPTQRAVNQSPLAMLAEAAAASSSGGSSAPTLFAPADSILVMQLSTAAPQWFADGCSSDEEQGEDAEEEGAAAGDEDMPGSAAAAEVETASTPACQTQQQQQELQGQGHQQETEETAAAPACQTPQHQQHQQQQHQQQQQQEPQHHQQEQEPKGQGHHHQEQEPQPQGQDQQQDPQPQGQGHHHQQVARAAQEDVAAAAVCTDAAQGRGLLLRGLWPLCKALTGRRPASMAPARLHELVARLPADKVADAALEVQLFALGGYLRHGHRQQEEEWLAAVSGCMEVVQVALGTAAAAGAPLPAAAHTSAPRTPPLLAAEVCAALNQCAQDAVSASALPQADQRLRSLKVAVVSACTQLERVARGPLPTGMDWIRAFAQLPAHQADLVLSCGLDMVAQQLRLDVGQHHQSQQPDPGSELPSVRMLCAMMGL